MNNNSRCFIEPAFSQHEYAVAYCETHDQPADQCRVKEQYREYCDRCDGVGWYEGGKYLQTTCEKCNGTGWADGKP